MGYSYIVDDDSLIPVTGTEVTSYSKKFHYDHMGRLIYETTSKTLYNGENEFTKIVFLYDEGAMVGMEYTSPLNEKGIYYYLRNLQGDVIAIYDTYGTLKVKYKYDAWGNCTIASGTTDYTLARINPIRYRGYYFDADTGLYYLNARYYNPEWRRFISPDSTEYIDSENPNGLNLYAYCNNDPVNYADPSGHGVIETMLDVISVGFSFYDFLNDPSWKNAGWLAMDVALFFIPFVPAVSRLAKGASNIDNVVDAAHGFTKIDNIQDAIVIGNITEGTNRVRDVAEIQGAVFYGGYRPIEILKEVGKKPTLGMEILARIDNTKWLVDKVWKGYKILDIGKDGR